MTNADWLSIGPYDRPIMSTETTLLIEKLEAWEKETLRSSEGKSLWGREYFSSLATDLRSTITTLQQAQEDSAILDFIDKHLISVSHARASHSVYMDGTTIHGKFENVDRANGGGCFRRMKGRNIRDAVRAATTPAREEGEG